MQTINELLDLAKQRNGIESDRQLGMALGRGNMPRYRKGYEAPNDITAIRLAELCGMKPGEVIAICHAIKAETPEERDIWEKFSKMAANMAVAFVITLAAATAAPGTASAGGSNLNNESSYPLCDVDNGMISAFMVLLLAAAAACVHVTAYLH